MQPIPIGQNSGERLFGLDLVRAIAICLVLFSHFFKALDILGFIGVELFFGLSGYLIGSILWRNFSSSWNWNIDNIFNFWSRRWWRTLPSYYLFLLFSIMISPMPSETLPPLQELSKFIWFGQSLTKHYNWFYGVSWSLCIEEWFYILFPILLFTVSLFCKNKKVTYVFAIAIIFFFSFITKWTLYTEGVEADLRLITVGRLDAVACGVLVAYLEKNAKSIITSKNSLFIIGLFILTGILITIFTNDMSVEIIESNPYLLTFFPMGFAFILPFFSTLKKPSKTKWFVTSSVENLSLWSYSIYLSHMVILITIYFLQDTFITFDVRASTLGNFATKLFGFITILLVSSYLYNHFELPLTRRRPQELDYTKGQVNFS